VGFFSNSEMGRSDHPQALRQAFLVDFSGILQLKNTVLSLIGTQEMRNSSFEKWVWPGTYASKNEEQTWGFVGRILKE